MEKYDYLIVGSGLFGATFAYKARKAGKRCLVIDRRPHLGGNVYCPTLTLPRSQGGRFHRSKIKGEVKGPFCLQSEPLDLQSLATIEPQEARAQQTNIQYIDTLER